MKVKILFDISVLGQGHFDPLSRTGVFRYIENLLVGLLKDQRVVITLVSSTGNYIECIKYLKDSNISELEKFKYPNSLFLKLISDLIFSKHSIFRFLMKAFRKVRLLFDRGDRKSWEYICKISDDYHVYHSGFYKIPVCLNDKQIIKILSVMDMIPIKFPQYFTNTSHSETFKHTLSDFTDSYRYICISEATKLDLIAYNKKINPKNVYVTHLAASSLFYPVDEEIIKVAKRKYGIPYRTKYFLSLCTLEPRKNISTIIKAYRKFRENHDTIGTALVLVGAKGWDDKKLQELTDWKDMKNSVIFPGYIVDEDLAAIYSGALAFIYLSYYEGFGLPPLEAMQCGIPVISSDRSSLPEVVGDAGILIAPDNIEQAEKALSKIYFNIELAKELRKKSLYQAKKFNWDKCTEETINIYLMR